MSDSAGVFRVALALAFALATAAGCGGGGDAPTSPDPPTEPAPPASSQVDSVAVTPAQTPVIEGESVQLSARGFDASGRELSDLTFSWSSDESSIASVDETGLVTGLESGRVTVTASVDGVSGAAEIKVRTGKTIAVDSTAFALVSDSTERVNGLYRFDLRSGVAPDWKVGDIIVGVERGGYLRRITEVVTRDAEGIELYTEQAALADAVETGSFQETFRIGPAASSSTLRQGDVIVGPTQAVGFSPSITVSDGALVLRDHVLYEDTGPTVCVGDGDSQVCVDGELRLTIPEGRIAFSPTVDLGFTLGFFSIEEARFVAEGDLEFDLDAELSVTSGWSYEGTVPLDRGFFRTPFVAYIAGVPVAGEVRMEFLAGYRFGTESRVMMRSGVRSDLGARLGALYEDGSWTPVFDASAAVESAPVTVDAEGEGMVRVFIRPRIRVLFYSVLGPTGFTESFLQGRITYGEECLVQVESGLDAGLTFDVEILSIELTPYTRSVSLRTYTLAILDLPCVANRSPTATITSPDSGASFAEGDVVTFAGYGEDPEDGDLAGEALEWSSDRDGYLGAGTDLTRDDLSEGTHTITLTATDSDGDTGADTVVITVESSSADCVPGEGPWIYASSAGSSLRPSILYRTEVTSCGTDMEVGVIRTSDGLEPQITDLAFGTDGTLWAATVNSLYRVDPTTATAIEVGPIGLGGVAGLTADGNGGLFGSTATASNVGTGELVTIDPSSGAGEVVGNFGSGFDGHDLSFAADGTLFAVGKWEFPDYTSAWLLATVDSATGEATRVGDGEGTDFLYIWGLAAVDGRLFGVTGVPSETNPGKLIELRLDGTATLIRELSFSAGGATAPN